MSVCMCVCVCVSVAVCACGKTASKQNQTNVGGCLQFLQLVALRNALKLPSPFSIGPQEICLEELCYPRENPAVQEQHTRFKEMEKRVHRHQTRHLENASKREKNCRLPSKGLGTRHGFERQVRNDVVLAVLPDLDAQYEQKPARVVAKASAGRLCEHGVESRQDIQPNADLSLRTCSVCSLHNRQIPRSALHNTIRSNYRITVRTRKVVVVVMLRAKDSFKLLRKKENTACSY